MGKLVPAVLKPRDAGILYPIRSELWLLLAGISDRLEFLTGRDEKPEGLPRILASSIRRRRRVNDNEEISQLTCLKLADQNVGTVGLWRLGWSALSALNLKDKLVRRLAATNGHVVQWLVPMIERY